jgi:hypothetical protein
MTSKKNLRKYLDDNEVVTFNVDDLVSGLQCELRKCALKMQLEAVCQGNEACYKKEMKRWAQKALILCNEGV